MDFGIARALADSSSTMTQTAAVVGTAQYLSPEQARGETVDSRSDVYSTGCLLYELLTGRPPFVGDSPVSVAYQHVREQAQPPSHFDHELPPEVDAIVMKALTKRVEDRYQSASAMRADIERYLAGKPVVAPVVPAAGRRLTREAEEPTSSSTASTGDEEPGRSAPRRWPAVLAVLAVLALLGLAVVSAALLLEPRPRRGPCPARQPDPGPGGAALTAAGLDGRDGQPGGLRGRPPGPGHRPGPRPPGTLAPGSDVDLTVSTGRPDVTVPYVSGTTVTPPGRS